MPQAPPGVDVVKNIKETQKHFWWDPKFPIWFYNQVRNRGPWDYKQLGSQYEDFGNFHYGVVGKAGYFPDQVLFRMAGWAQTRSGNYQKENGSPWGKAPYGDDPRDQAMIQKGIWWYKNCYKKRGQ
ncbi:MAG: type IV secretion protein Rhs [Firmicutes bacterium]|nr:type IV secretion protein Rhs [Bacillota bacterium]